MRSRLATAVAILALTGAPLGAQEVVAATAPGGDSASVVTSAVLAPISPLPAALLPVATRPPDWGIRESASDATPYLGAVVGAAVGLVAARWFVARGCKENCSGDLLLTSALGILMGGAIGYRLAGGDIGDIDGPPPTRPWP
jgi:hypothetical protein